MVTVRGKITVFRAALALAAALFAPAAGAVRLRAPAAVATAVARVPLRPTLAELEQEVERTRGVLEKQLRQLFTGLYVSSVTAV